MSIPPKFYHERKKIARSKLESIIDYLNSEDCTNVFLLNYFGEKDAAKCGKCNKCIVENEFNYSVDLQSSIETYLNESFKDNEQIEIIDVIAEFSTNSKEEIVNTIRWLVDHDMVIIDPLGKRLSKA